MTNTKVKEDKNNNIAAKAAVAQKESKTKKKTQDDIVVLASGIRVRYRPVGANAIREAQARIPDAIMPTFKDPNTGKDQPNPAHPAYAAEQKEIDALRTTAAMDVLMLLGIELVDDMPEDDAWLDKFVFLKLISTEDAKFARDLPIALELYYKKYVVADANVITQLGQLAGVTQEMIAEARDSFPSNA